MAGTAVVAARSSSGIGERSSCRRRERASDNGSRDLPLHADNLLLEYQPTLLLPQTGYNLYMQSPNER
jgi:hypothetical protein